MLISKKYEVHDEKTFINNMDSFKCLTPNETKGMSLLDVPVTMFGCYEDVIGCPRHCRCWLRSWDKAVRVECMNRNLTQLPAVLPDRTYILNYSRNLLTDLTDLPEYFESIQIMDISQNNIAEIKWDFIVKLSNINNLRLHDNGITTLPKVSTVICCLIVSSYSETYGSSPWHLQESISIGVRREIHSWHKGCYTPIEDNETNVDRTFVFPLGWNWHDMDPWLFPNEIRHYLGQTFNERSSGIVELRNHSIGGRSPKSIFTLWQLWINICIFFQKFFWLFEQCPVRPYGY